MVGTPRHYYISLAVFFVALSLTFYLVREEEWVVHDKIAGTSYTCPAPTEETPNPLLRDAVSSLFSSIRHDPSTSSYRSPFGQTFTTKDTIWQNPLRKRLLILDVDKRPSTAGVQVLNPSTINFEKFDLAKGGAASRGIMNHYFYALVHGYDYHYFQPAPNETTTKDGTWEDVGLWMLPHALRKKITQHEFVVAMDPDVAIPHMEVPMEWMFNRWGVQEHTSIAMPLDSPSNLKSYNGKLVNEDSQGERMLNTGFVVAQNSAVTRDMLEKWRDCRSENRYAGCKEWKGTVGHEMGAFSEYVRYDYNFTMDTIVGIDCDDAVAWPASKQGSNAAGNGGKVSDCKGSFVRHFEMGNEDEKNSAILSTMNPLADVLQKQLTKNKDTKLFKERIGKATEKDGKWVPLILEGVIPGTGGKA